MAAGALIVSEAGGVVLDPSGGEFDLMSRDILVCSSRQLADQVLGFLRSYKTDRDLKEKYIYLSSEM
jgi:myo-inositol-1(or 4)-monophosphatase